MSTKSVLDAALGTSITCSFAFGEVGVVAAAVIAGGKFVFDILYPNNPQDYWAQPATRKDLIEAVGAMKKIIPEAIWQGKTEDFLEVMAESRRNLLLAMDEAGKPQSIADGVAVMSGDTTVWNQGDFDNKFAPILAGDDLLGLLIGRFQTHGEMNKDMMVAYMDVVSYFLYMARVGISWEINNNIKAYVSELNIYKAEYNKVKPLQDAWDKYEQKHPGAKHGERPVLTVHEPMIPADDDPVFSSEISSGDGTMLNARSHLGPRHSLFAQMVQGKLPDYIKFAKDIVDKWVADWILAQDDVIDMRASVQVTETDGGYRIDLQSEESLKYISEGSFAKEIIPDKRVAEMAADVLRGQLTYPYYSDRRQELDLIQFNSDELEKLQKVVKTWEEILDIYNGKSKGRDPHDEDTSS